MKKIPVGILGATGMVGQRLITLLENHPWFEVVCVAASPSSAGKTYREVVSDKWVMKGEVPLRIGELTVLAVEKDIKKIAEKVSFVFSALNVDKETTIKIENEYATSGVGVVSNNSANRWTDDVPMIIPEINPHHLELLEVQRKQRKWQKGFIVVKPNCSIQSYVPQITALLAFKPNQIIVTTLQAISGAGKTFVTWPEMMGNVIPFIGGEEDKSEKEPLRIWGSIENNKVKIAENIQISATCIRVPVTDGHMASVALSFEKKPNMAEIKDAWRSYRNPIENMHLPSAPQPFLNVFSEEDRPQTLLDRDVGNGMGISVGRLREDRILDYKFIGLSHNTIRGAAGGSILTAELLKMKGYIYG